MRCPRKVLLLALLGAGCATAHAPAAADRPADDLGDRIARRALSALGQKGPFTVGALHFPPDCSGFVTSLYEAEGIPLRKAMSHVAPKETSGVAATYAVAKAYGVVFGGGGEWPRKGDLVFFRNTFDRNHDRNEDAPLTHLGVVLEVDGGTITFLHRGKDAVSRGVMTLEHPDLAKDPDGRRLNTVLRDKKPQEAHAPSLAGELFMAFARIDPARMEGHVASRY